MRRCRPCTCGRADSSALIRRPAKKRLSHKEEKPRRGALLYGVNRASSAVRPPTVAIGMRNEKELEGAAERNLEGQPSCLRPANTDTRSGKQSGNRQNSVATPLHLCTHTKQEVVKRQRKDNGHLSRCLQAGLHAQADTRH